MREVISFNATITYTNDNEFYDKGEFEIRVSASEPASAEKGMETICGYFSSAPGPDRDRWFPIVRRISSRPVIQEGESFVVTEGIGRLIFRPSEMADVEA